MMRSPLNNFLFGIVLTLVTHIAHAAILPLESRLGGLAYYDPNLNITWAANADINGIDTWENQNAWAASVTIGGVGGWRLPTADANGDGVVADCFGVGDPSCIDSEMGYLFWVEGITGNTPGPFSNLTGFSYWSSTEFDAANAIRFAFNFGIQREAEKTGTIAAWAVQSGDVGAIPIPGAVWLFGSGLVGLLSVAKRKRL